MSFKRAFIPASALLAMCSIYIRLWQGPAAAPLIVRMRIRLGGVAMVCDYPHPALSPTNPIDINKTYISKLHFTSIHWCPGEDEI